jgi:hypothetical protein
MEISFRLALSVALFAALSAANPYDTPIAALAMTAPTNSITPIPSSSVPTNAGDVSITIRITNLYGTQLSLAFSVNTSTPSPATVLPNAVSTQYTFPTGWAGRIIVGLNSNNWSSKIEGSYIDSLYDIDVSYVDGYTVPITCSSQGVAVTGCNIELFDQPVWLCDDIMNLPNGRLCHNSMQNFADGPPPCFFAACKGAAYTYPTDDGANRSQLGSNLVSCCIGTSCDAPIRQPGLGNHTIKCVTFA